VSAKDQGTGKEQSMTISGGSALAKEEIERMVKDAEAHAEEDKQRRAEAEARNSAEQLVYSTEKFLKDNEDKIPADSRGSVDSGLADLKDALKDGSGATPDEIAQKTEALAKVSQELGTAMYAASQAAEQAEAPGSQGATGDGGASGGAGSGPSEAGSDDDVVDAEVVDEDK
jgi:molecular chaperone DnaK